MFTAFPVNTSEKKVAREDRQTLSSGVHLSNFIAPRKFLFAVDIFFQNLPEESAVGQILKYDNGKMR